MLVATLLETILINNSSNLSILRNLLQHKNRSSHPGLFLRKRVLKICSKFTGKHPCRSVISIKLLSSFIEITLQHRCSPESLLHIFKTPFPRNTSVWLLLPISVLHNISLPKYFSETNCTAVILVP